MKDREDFCVFILTHGRPDNQYTLRTLLRRGYSGKYFFVVDDEDPTVDQMREKYGEDKVLQFCKAEIAETFDEADIRKDRRTIVYARNACFQLAREVGCRYFMEFDDDYTTFAYRFDKELNYGWYGIYDLDSLFAELLAFYESVPTLFALCIAQGGDHAGGAAGSYGKKVTLTRKAMNTFLCSTDRPYQFYGRVNEDVNVYTESGRRGMLFLTVNQAQIVQVQTQKTKGGMTETYLDNGTYIKSFYTVMYAPSCVTVGQVGQSHKRLHHRVNWRTTVPKILHERWRE